MYNNVQLKEYRMYVKQEVRVLSQRSVGFVGFCHQMHLLKFIVTVYRKNLNLKRRKKQGRV